MKIKKKNLKKLRAKYVELLEARDFEKAAELKVKIEKMDLLLTKKKMKQMREDMDDMDSFIDYHD
jgi:excinuclease UvrABC nuclease subunit